MRIVKSILEFFSSFLLVPAVVAVGVNFDMKSGILVGISLFLMIVFTREVETFSVGASLASLPITLVVTLMTIYWRLNVDVARTILLLAAIVYGLLTASWLWKVA